MNESPAEKSGGKEGRRDIWWRDEEFNDSRWDEWSGWQLKWTGINSESVCLQQIRRTHTMLTIKDDSLRYYTISYAIFNQLSYLINSSGQMLSECLTEGLSACVMAAAGGRGWVVITPVMGKRRSVNLKNRETTLKNRKTGGMEEADRRVMKPNMNGSLSLMLRNQTIQVFYWNFTFDTVGVKNYLTLVWA